MNAHTLDAEAEIVPGVAGSGFTVMVTELDFEQPDPLSLSVKV